MRKIDFNNAQEAENYLDIDRDEKIYFKMDDDDKPKVNQIVNDLLVPYGFESYSENQFERIAGGSKHSSNKIRNYHSDDKRGTIKYGYTYLNDILAYCKERLESSVLIPMDKVYEEFRWAKKMINSGNLTLHSGRGKRYDIQAMLDVVKGNLCEVGFKIDAKNNGVDVGLNREMYSNKTTTDEGQDVKYVGDENNKPNSKIQIKDIKYFFLVEESEFNGNRAADYFVGYRTQWNKENTGQRFLRSLGSQADKIFDDYPELDGIRVSRKGWAMRDDFDELPSGDRYKGKSFRDDNMFVYYDDLRDMELFFENHLSRM